MSYDLVSSLILLFPKYVVVLVSKSLLSYSFTTWIKSLLYTPYNLPLSVNETVLPWYSYLVVS